MLEGAGGAEQRDGGEDDGHGQPVACGAQRQHDEGRDIENLAARNDAASVDAVGQRADDEGERHHRQELRKADEAEVVGRARARIDEPADRHARHLEG